MGLMKKALLQTLAYADIFDYPLKEEEIKKFLIGQVVTKNQIWPQLSQVVQKNGFFFLKGREKIVNLRRKRQKWSQEKIKKAQNVSHWLKLIPTIKMVALTGALAMENAEKEDDIDFLIITAKKRLWLTRLLTVFLVELVAKRRHPYDQVVKDKICLNMFLDEEHLTVPSRERDLFTAHEISQLKPLWDRNETYSKLIQKNLWVKDFLPNWKP
jgi:hypothetical protein